MLVYCQNMQSFHTICAHARLIMCRHGHQSMYRPEFVLLCVLVLLALVIMVSDGKCCRARHCCRETERCHRLHKERVATEAASVHHLTFFSFCFHILVIAFNCPCVSESASGESAGALQLLELHFPEVPSQITVVWMGSSCHL